MKKRDRGREEPFSLREGKKQRHATPHPLIPKNTQRESERERERKREERERREAVAAVAWQKWSPRKSGDRNRERERAMTNGFFLPAGAACDVLGIPSLS